MATHLANAQANELKLIVEKTFADAQSLFGRMAMRRMRFGEVHKFLELLFPKTKRQQEKGENPERWTRIESILEDHTVTPPATRDTLWGLYNAIVRDEDYRASREASSEARLDRVWFGSGQELKLKALEAGRRYLKAAA